MDWNQLAVRFLHNKTTKQIRAKFALDIESKRSGAWDPEESKRLKQLYKFYSNNAEHVEQQRQTQKEKTEAKGLKPYLKQHVLWERIAQHFPRRGAAHSRTEVVLKCWNLAAQWEFL
jgi:hypothetical protein